MKLGKQGLCAVKSVRGGFWFISGSAILGIWLYCSALAMGGQKQGSGGGVAPPTDRGASEWKRLFDGKTATGWRGFHSNEFPSCWRIENGAFHRSVGKDIQGTSCGDLVTRDQYANFELELEWKMSAAGNSGIKYLISQERPGSWERTYYEIERKQLLADPAANQEALAALKPDRWANFPIGFEFQLIDDEKNEDAKKSPKRITGSLYDLLAPTRNVPHPVGIYHKARIRVQGNHIEHWINGEKALEYDREGRQLKDAIAESKFMPMKGFGTVSKGHITLQDHDCEVWFRNIRIRTLPPK